MVVTKREALRARRSVKDYLDAPLAAADRAALLAAIDKINAASGLNVQLIEDEPRVFRTFVSAATGLISARNYFAMVGPRGPELERSIGYWGQELVLETQMLGLRTNWTGGSCRLGLSSARVEEGEKLVIVIAVGYGASEPKPRSTRPARDLCRVPGGYESAPEWFRAGIDAAQLAPTGYNRQKFEIELCADGRCDARRTSRLPQTNIDLGIVMRNFEVGAGVENVHWVSPIT